MRIARKGVRVSDANHEHDRQEYHINKACKSLAYLTAEKLGKLATVAGRLTGKHGFGGSQASIRKALEAKQRTFLSLQLQGWRLTKAAKYLPWLHTAEHEGRRSGRR